VRSIGQCGPSKDQRSAGSGWRDSRILVLTMLVSSQNNLGVYPRASGVLMLAKHLSIVWIFVLHWLQVQDSMLLLEVE